MSSEIGFSDIMHRPAAGKHKLRQELSLIKMQLCLAKGFVRKGPFPSADFWT